MVEYGVSFIFQYRFWPSSDGKVSLNFSTSGLLHENKKHVVFSHRYIDVSHTATLPSNVDV